MSLPSFSGSSNDQPMQTSVEHSWKSNADNKPELASVTVSNPEAPGYKLHFTVQGKTLRVEGGSVSLSLHNRLLYELHEAINKEMAKARQAGVSVSSPEAG